MMDFVIAGMQRCTLADFPGEVACTVFTQGCNWRCPCCRNGSLIGKTASRPVTIDELTGFLRTRRGRIGGVVVTGGEPTLQPDLAGFCARIKSMGLKVKLETSGTCPSRLSHLLAEGLVDYVAMDIKQTPERYCEATGCVVDTAALAASIDLLRRSNVDYEFRITVVPAQHTAADIGAIARWVAGAKVLYLQAFQPRNALSPRLRQSQGPTEIFLRECQALALPHLPTLLR